MINEQNKIIYIGHFSSNQALMAHNKGNYNKNAKNNHKPPTQGSNNSSTNVSSDVNSNTSSNNYGNAPSNASKNKFYETCKCCGKFHIKKFC